MLSKYREGMICVPEYGAMIPRSYKTALKKAVRGEGIYIFDEDKKPYIDGCSGALLSSVGHGNKEIADAIYKQLTTLEFAHPSRWYNEATMEASKEVASMSPEELNYVWLVSGGSEAIESALKLARQYFVERDGVSSAKYVMIARWNSYHGSTIGTMGLAGSMARRRTFYPLYQDYPKIASHYCYRCPFGLSYPSCDIRCAYDLEHEIRKIGAQYIAAFVAEPIVGSTVGGLHPPKEYWPIVRDICSKYDVLLIADEIMTGIGRTGKNFCLNHWNVVPDMICSAKALSGGYSPVGALIVKDEIIETLKEGSGAFQHGHTYNANPVTAAAVTATLRLIKREGLVENAYIQGERLGKKLQSLYEIPIVGDVRGMGLMRGIEIVADPATRQAFPSPVNAAGVVTNECLKQGLVVYPGRGQIDGIEGDQFLVAPPLIVTEQDVDEIFTRLEKGLRAARDILLPRQ
jgi:adenosylmethionine-8-amino-7-oxononanoate aminotransferase